MKKLDAFEDHKAIILLKHCHALLLKLDRPEARMAFFVEDIGKSSASKKAILTG